MTAALAAPVLHTQMTNVAVWPAFTSAELETDSIRTQSCGVLCVLWTGGVVDDGLGLGLGEFLLGLGVGVGVIAGLDEELPDGDAALELDVPGLDVLGLDEGLVLAEPLDDAEADAELVAVRLAGWYFGAISTAFVASTVFFGISGHAELTIPWLDASTAKASLNMLQLMNMNADSAPTAAGLTISALTCPTSLRWSAGAGSPLLPS